MALFSEQIIKVRGRNVKLLRGGAGAPVIFLHDAFCPAWLPLHDRLASEFEIFVPIHPGFAGSEDGFDQFETMEDLVIHYLDLCETLKLERPALAGASFGGWIAAEWAIRYSERLRGLILIDALGLRLPEAPVADLLNLDGPALRRTLFNDPKTPLLLRYLYRAQLPSLILWGARDSYVPIAHANAYHHGIANAEFAAIAGGRPSAAS